MGDCVGALSSAYLCEEFADFGLTIDDDDLLMDKINDISLSFGLNGEDMVNEMIAFANNLKKKKIDFALVQQFEPEYAKKATRVESVPKTPKRSVLGDVTSTFRRKIDDDMMDTTIDLNQTLGGKESLPVKYQHIAPITSSLSNTKFQSRTDAGSVMHEHKGRLFVGEEASVRSKRVSVDVVSGTPLCRFDTSVAIIDAKCSRIDRLTAAYEAANEGIKEWTAPRHIGTDEVYIIGEAVRDDAGAWMMMGDDECAAPLPIELSPVQEWSVFPGQIVALRGSNPTGSRFVASEQLQCAPAPVAVCTNPAEHISVWCAAGPFTSPETCSYEQLTDLLDAVKKEQPDVLVLMGPLVDRRHKWLLSTEATASFQQVYHTLLYNLSKAVDGWRTRVFLQPHVRDAGGAGVFPGGWPALPDGVAKMTPNVNLIADPCVIRVGGVEIAINGSEIVQHLSRAEEHRSGDAENRDRMGRLTGHLLSQHSLYPLHPSPIPVNLEECIRLSSTPTTPHLLIAPSVLPSYVKPLHGCVCVNPGQLTRGANGAGCFVKVSVTPSYWSQQTGVVDCSSVQIVKV